MSDVRLATKKCTKCYQRKPLSEFYRDKNKPDGRAYWCRDCSIEYQKERRQARREEMGVEAWNRYQADIAKRHRERNPENASKEGTRAIGRAMARLRDAHPEEYALLLREERYRLGLNVD